MPIIAFYSKDSNVELQNEWENRLKAYYPSINLVPLLCDQAGKAITALLWKAPLQSVKKLNNLKALISLGQGVDHILKDNIIDHNIPVIRIVDPFMAKSMSHWVILSVLNYVRDTFGYYDQQLNKIYKPRKAINFTTLKVAVYGIGAIGSVVAKDLNQLGFKVKGWSRTQKHISGINCHYGKNKFKDLLKTCDIHICLLPLTPETFGIFNNSSFKMMKYGSCFINAGRGEQVVEEHLIESCKSGHISSAILDVYQTEPLPKNSILWEQKNIKIWPHVAAETNPETAAKQIVNAIKCIENGKKPPNTIKRILGY
jgi:glyoxylate/hydroxypyruvate reductase A